MLALAGDITYIYDATEVKQKKITPAGSSLKETIYTGNYVYVDGVLKFFNTAEGYVEPTDVLSGEVRYIILPIFKTVS